MLREERYTKVLEWFAINMPEADTELIYQDPFSLLVAVVLSAQCTDKRINKVTPALMSLFRTPEAMATASYNDIHELIKSVSYPTSKTKYLMGLSKKLVSDFNSIVPSSLEDLQKLPGVGRKTANVIAAIIYNLPVIAVDTHVFRVSKRIGLTNGKTVEKVEEELTKNIPPERRLKFHHQILLHGRRICLARKPHCEKCGLSPYCLYYEKNIKD